MEKCPYCQKEVSLKLSMQFISEIDPSVYNVQSKIIDQMPRMFQGFMRGALNTLGSRPIPVFILSCTNCGTALDFEFSLGDNNS